MSIERLVACSGKRVVPHVLNCIATSLSILTRRTLLPLQPNRKDITASVRTSVAVVGTTAILYTRRYKTHLTLTLVVGDNNCSMSARCLRFRALLCTFINWSAIVVCRLNVYAKCILYVVKIEQLWREAATVCLRPL